MESILLIPLHYAQFTNTKKRKKEKKCVFLCVDFLFEIFQIPQPLFRLIRDSVIKRKLIRNNLNMIVVYFRSESLKLCLWVSTITIYTGREKKQQKKK